jgi:hypothetical protein
LILASFSKAEERAFEVPPYEAHTSGDFQVFGHIKAETISDAAISVWKYFFGPGITKYF